MAVSRAVQLVAVLGGDLAAETPDIGAILAVITVNGWRRCLR